MALPSSGQISISQIRNELNPVYGSSYSLRQLSSWAGKSTPDAMSEFWGYSPAVTVSINTVLPTYVGCYNYYGFTAFTNTAVNTDVTVTIYWYGDLGGQFNSTVTIYNGTTCGDNYNAYSGGRIYCGGEYYNYSALYFYPATSGNQTYEQGYNTQGIACL